MSNTFLVGIIIAVILIVVKNICDHIAYVGFVYLSNKEKRDHLNYIKQMWGEDWELAIEESREILQQKDREWANREATPLKKYKEKVDFSVISNNQKKQVAINLWDYYYNFLLCRKDLKYSQDSRIRIIYYAKKISTSIEIMLNSQGTAIQFWNVYYENLKRMAIRKARVLDSKDLPESIRKKLEKEAA